LLPELLGGRRKFVHSSGADSNACIGKWVSTFTSSSLVNGGAIMIL
jgi:hypothetical protein